MKPPSSFKDLWIFWPFAPFDKKKKKLFGVKNIAEKAFDRNPWMFCWLEEAARPNTRKNSIKKLDRFIKNNYLSYLQNGPAFWGTVGMETKVWWNGCFRAYNYVDSHGLNAQKDMFNKCISDCDLQCIWHHILFCIKAQFEDVHQQ